MKEPRCRAIPPDDALYQSTVTPLAAVADSATVPERQTDPFVVVGEAGFGLIVGVTLPVIVFEHDVVLSVATTV